MICDIEKEIEIWKRVDPTVLKEQIENACAGARFHAERYKVLLKVEQRLREQKEQEGSDVQRPEKIRRNYRWIKGLQGSRFNWEQAKAREENRIYRSVSLLLIDLGYFPLDWLDSEGSGPVYHHLKRLAESVVEYVAKKPGKRPSSEDTMNEWDGEKS